MVWLSPSCSIVFSIPFLFYSVVNRYSKVHNFSSSLILLITISCWIIIIIIIISSLCEFFTPFLFFFFFFLLKYERQHVSSVSETLLSVLADLNSAAFWMALTLPLIYNSSGEITVAQWVTWWIVTSKYYLPNPSARAGCDSRLMFQQSLTGLNSEFSFS